MGGDVALLGPLWNNDWKLAQISFFRTVIEQLKYYTIVVDSFPVLRCCVLAPAMGGHWPTRKILRFGSRRKFSKNCDCR